MSRIFENHVSFYGTAEEVNEARHEVVLLCEKLSGHDGPETIERWDLGGDFEMQRLWSFDTDHWESPEEYLDELSKKYLNVVFEWSYTGDAEFYCRVVKNGHLLFGYETWDLRKNRKLADKFYYLKALRFAELAHES
jgi:Ferredoxin-like domain in Api92-like protein